MTTKHTPGPWKYNEDGDGYLIQGGHHSQYGHLYVANCQVSSAHRDAEETLANIRLIAAAPDMEKALQICADWFCARSNGIENALQLEPGDVARIVKSALQKAGAA